MRRDGKQTEVACLHLFKLGQYERTYAHASGFHNLRLTVFNITNCKILDGRRQNNVAINDRVIILISEPADIERTGLK